MRLYGELVVIGIAASCVAWMHRAPREPAERATYLCRPVGAAAAALDAIARLAFGGATAPTHPWDSALRQQCVRFVEEVSVHEGE